MDAVIEPLKSDAAISTLASTLAGQIRLAILWGELPPGAKLRLADLREQYEVSLSPLREALSKLSMEGLVVAEDQKGYRVAPVSAENLKEVVKLRSHFESIALAEAISTGGDEWEERLVAVFHRLSKLERDSARKLRIEDWERAHRVFHTALIAGCGMPLLLQFCGTLHDLNDRYRRLFLKKYPAGRDVCAEHLAIYEATLARDAKKACELLRRHIARTGELLLKAQPKKFSTAFEKKKISHN